MACVNGDLKKNFSSRFRSIVLESGESDDFWHRLKELMGILLIFERATCRFSYRRVYLSDVIV